MSFGFIFSALWILIVAAVAIFAIRHLITSIRTGVAKIDIHGFAKDNPLEFYRDTSPAEFWGTIIFYALIASLGIFMLMQVPAMISGIGAG